MSLSLSIEYLCCLLCTWTKVLTYTHTLPHTCFRASTASSTYICWTKSRADVLSRRGESVDFGFVSHNDYAHKSSSLFGASGCSRSSSAWDLWPSRPCHRFESHDSVMFTTPYGLIAISGYKLLYLHSFAIFIFPRLIIHDDSLRIVLYPSSANIPMETRLLFSTGTCQTWCMVIVLSFGNWMGTSPIHACCLVGLYR